MTGMRPRLATLAVFAVAGCAAAPAPPTLGPAAVNGPTPAPAAPASVIVLPASNHITGVYPTGCHAVTLAPGELGPDPRCTPGAASAAVTQANIKTTICRQGFTTTIRAGQAETGRLKPKAMAAYGLDIKTRSTTELDHLVALELGGSNDARNLWAQPSDLPGRAYLNRKDGVEGSLRSAVCSGRTTLAAARDAIAANWTTAKAKLGVS
jgi:hypothetical protein